MAGCGGPEEPGELGLAAAGELADRVDPVGMELLGRHPADAPEALDRKREQERLLLRRRDEEQPVGLRHPAGHLRQDLRPRGTDAEGEADLLADAAAEPNGDLPWRPGDPLETPDVEEGLLHRQALDPRGGLLEDLEQRLARLGVGREAGGDEGRMRAQPAGPPAAHPAVDAVGARLVAGGGHHPRADDRRAAAQPGVVPLLDRGVEGVGVGVQDPGVPGHEHMFAPDRRSVNRSPSRY
jgi:hypothetical protein